MRTTLFLSILILLIPGALAIAQQQGAAPGAHGGTITTAASPDADNDGVTPPRRSHTDPFLQYAENVNVRISQLEFGDFPTVRAFVSVTDQNGILLRNLEEQDFAVTENGVEAAEVRFANRDELDLPLAIQLVLDISGSMDVQVDAEGNTALDLAKQAVRDFAGQLAPRDRLGLITFSDAAIREVRLTTDRSDLTRSLDRLVPWGQTTLWDAIFLGMEELVADSDPARRALIVLSDGWDNNSQETPQSILTWYEDQVLAKNLGFSVYTIGLGTEIDRGALGNIATRTGGLYLSSPSAEDLANLYQDILTQIQSEYFLEWDSPAESTAGQIIDVTVNVTAVRSCTPGTYTYRSPGLAAALARAIWPGLLAIAILIAILVIATIFRIARRTWLTVMITPLEGKDYAVGSAGVDIGSTESCEIRLAGDPAMLPIHALLRESHDGYILEAVDPHSPIIARGQLLAKKLLRTGDRFKLGTTEFVFNERVVRPGDGSHVLAEHIVDLDPVMPLSEDAQFAGESAETAGPRPLPSVLLAISGPHSGERFALSPGENTIGRQDGSIVLAADSQLSRRHCVITLSEDSAILVDPGSTNGTRLNSQACQPGMPQAVRAGDTLAIGSGEYRLE